MRGKKIHTNDCESECISGFKLSHNKPYMHLSHQAGEECAPSIQEKKERNPGSREGVWG